MLNKLAKIKELDGRMSNYDVPISNPQAIRFVAEFMHRTGLLGRLCTPDPSLSLSFLV
jgi:hypothetical protein